MPFIRKVHVLHKTRLIFSRINGPTVSMDFFTIYGVGFGLENVTNFLTHLTILNPFAPGDFCRKTRFETGQAVFWFLSCYKELKLTTKPFSSGIVERAKRERAPVKSTPREKRRHIFLSPCRVSPFLAWGDFHARSRFARCTIPEEKWGILVKSTIKRKADYESY